MAYSDHADREIGVLRRQNVLLLVFLTLITLGIYYPVWFLIKKNRLNRLKSYDNLGRGIFVIAIFLILVSILLALPSSFLGPKIKMIAEQTGMKAVGPYFAIAEMANVMGLSAIIIWILGTIIILQTFKVRGMICDYYTWAYRMDIPFSMLGTLFLGIFFVQHKLNKILEIVEDLQQPPISARIHKTASKISGEKITENGHYVKFGQTGILPATEMENDRLEKPQMNPFASFPYPAELRRRIYDELLREVVDEATMLEAKILCDGDNEKSKLTYYRLRYEQVLESEKIERMKAALLNERHEESIEPTVSPLQEEEKVKNVYTDPSLKLVKPKWFQRMN